MSTFIEYTVNQGASFRAQLQIKDDVGVGISLVPYTVSGQVRRSYSSLNVSANIVCTMIDSPNGVLQLSMDYANTANVRAGRYVFDVEAFNSGTGEKVRLVEGMMTFTPEVTR
jgi:hypothetical protein